MIGKYNTVLEANKKLQTHVAVLGKSVNAAKEKAGTDKQLIGSLEAELAQKNAELKTVQQQMGELEQQFAALNGENRLLHNKLAEKEQELGALRRENNSLKTQLAQKEALVKNLNAQVESLNAQVNELTKQAQRSMEITEATRKLAHAYGIMLTTASAVAQEPILRSTRTDHQKIRP